VKSRCISNALIAKTKKSKPFNLKLMEIEPLGFAVLFSVGFALIIYIGKRIINPPDD